ncbi:hypothetical protein J2W15_003657 [Pseudarthrobacter sulfonivorans]|nr:hypothetical protein [Pseudarthrobacter sulfonivorans]
MLLVSRWVIVDLSCSLAIRPPFAGLDFDQDDRNLGCEQCHQPDQPVRCRIGLCPIDLDGAKGQLSGKNRITDAAA